MMCGASMYLFPKIKENEKPEYQKKEKKKKACKKKEKRPR
jgi:hypothetical protein